MAGHSVAAMTRAERALQRGRARRRALLDSPFPILFVESTPGAGARTLISEWAAEEDSIELRVVVRAEKIVARGPDVLRAVVDQVRSALAVAWEIPVGDADIDSGLDLAGALVDLLRRVQRHLVLAVTGADFLDADAFGELVRLLVARDRARLIVTGLDATELMGSRGRACW